MNNRLIALSLIFIQTGCCLSIADIKDLDILSSKFHQHQHRYGHELISPRDATENLQFRIIPVGVPVAALEKLTRTTCPSRSLTADQSMKFCTRSSCYALKEGGSNEDVENELVQVSTVTECLRSRCDDLEGDLYRKCVIDECCFADRDYYEAADDSGLTRPMTRKRRVNDDVSQCIQSYCSGKQFRDRILCIVKNCNRSILMSQ